MILRKNHSYPPGDILPHCLKRRSSLSFWSSNDCPSYIRTLIHDDGNSNQAASQDVRRFSDSLINQSRIILPFQDSWFREKIMLILLEIFCRHFKKNHHWSFCGLRWGHSISSSGELIFGLLRDDPRVERSRAVVRWPVLYGRPELFLPLLIGPARSLSTLFLLHSSREQSSGHQPHHSGSFIRSELEI